jgi:exo-beta-1,3-glucanase (GH17 family)
LHVGPSQNNITRDMAVMSQLTNAVRLYGTDCNQTQMLIHAIDRLEIKDTMKIWLGVWLDSNDTTTQRQIDQTWTILDDYGCDYFKGIIIGNEVLYRKDLTVTELLGHISDFRKNITAHHCQLPVAMADLGDNWDADMASKVDIVMSNVHPFFAGVDVKEAASWTWSFWQREDVALTAGNTNIKQIIAEVGWPSAGGKSCGSATSCSGGSVAGIDEMNQFMEDWICPSMKNKTEYFW